MYSNLEEWLIISHSGISHIKFNKLLQIFKDPKAILSATKQQLLQYGIAKKSIDLIHRPDKKKIKYALKWSQYSGHFILTKNNPHYPAQLLPYSYLPNVLFVQGDYKILTQPSLTLVGSRQPSQIGKKIAYTWSQHWSQDGFVIVSGLASGIDKYCHEGALSQNGKTAAVLGSGLECIYPKHHSKLVDQILSKNGAVISEFPLNTKPYKWNFPARNHTMSALSLATIVIEAGLKSGSLITAYAAIEQGKEVFAVPGSVFNPTAQGCHKIIKEGAYLLESYNDLINYFPASKFKQNAKNNNLDSKKQLLTLDEPYNKLLECIDYQLTSFDTIVIRSKLNPSRVRSDLQSLEYAGFIVAELGGYTRVKL